MSNNKDNVSLLYNGLIKKGYTKNDLGDEATFRSKMADEGSRKELYDYVSGRGDFRIGDYDTYNFRIGESYAQKADEPYTHEYDNSGKLIGGTAYQEPEPYQFKPEVQQHIIENKPDLFKGNAPSLMDAPLGVGANTPEFTGEKLGARKERAYEWSKRPITEFGESFKQGSEALYQGTKNLVGETANLFGGSQRDYTRAQSQLNELVQSGYDLNNFDVQQALKDYKDRDFQRKTAEWQKDIASRKEEREGMGFFDALLHRIQDPSRPKSQYEETGMLADEVQLQRAYYAIEDALKQTNGNVKAAFDLLGDKSSKETWGDEVTREARAELANQRPTEGFGAWVGGMLPQMAGNVAATAARFTPWGRWLTPLLGYGNMAYLTGATSGMSMAEARDYAERKGVAANEGEVWKTGMADAAIEYATEKIPFNRYFGKVVDGSKNVVGKWVADAVGKSDAAATEMGDLLSRASKEFGVGLFSGKNIKDYLLDVGTEGLSEFTAEALQTITPMIYQNPEDYPTLTAIVNNGWEGAKGGLFMGAFLGAGNRFANRYQDRKRREKAGEVTFAETKSGVFEVLGVDKEGKIVAQNSDGESVTLKNEEIIDKVTVPYEEFKNASMEKVQSDAEVQVEADNAIIDSVTDPRTGKYTEVKRIMVDEHGEQVAQPGYIVGWIGESPIFVPEGVENTTENRIPLKPNEWDPASLNELENNRVKALNEEMVREQAAEQAEMEATYAPEVLNAEMEQEKSFIFGHEHFTPVSVMPEGNGWVVDIRNVDENGSVVDKVVGSKELTNEEYRKMLQAQIEAQEAVQEEQMAAERQVAAEAEIPTTPMESQESTPTTPISTPTTPTSEDVQPTEEGVPGTVTGYNQKPAEAAAPVIPTKEDGSIDFVAYGKDNSFRTLGEKYGEKMPNKVAVTAKAFAEDLKKAQEKLAKAEEALDNAPIGREAKQEAARDKAKAELEAVKREADFWADMDADIKAAQAQREAILNPQAEVEATNEPMTADEFIAQQLAVGNIVLNKDSYKAETGFGDAEANAMNGGTNKLLSANGMTIEEAGERLMEMDRENGTNFFDQSDANAGRDAIISLLGSVKSRKELNQFIDNARAEQAKKESEGLRNELEKQVVAAHYESLEDFVLQMEAAEVESPFDGMDVATKDAIFAEAEEEYQRYLNGEEYGQGTTTENAEGSGSVLSEEQSDNSGGIEERQEQRDGVGERAVQESETAHVGQQETELKQQEGETPLQFAERAAEEHRRRPLRARVNEWAKALGVQPIFIESVEDAPTASIRAVIEAAHKNGQIAPGWVSGGKAYFFLEDLTDLGEVDKTFIHEVVAHKGLKEMLGEERFNELCDKVWEMMPQSEKDFFTQRYPIVKDMKGVTQQRAAADEYMAHLAERQNLTPEEKTVWDYIVQFVREALDKALNGIIGQSKITDEDIAKLIKMSYANLKSGANEGVVGEGTRFSAKWRKGQLDKASRTIRQWLKNNTRGKSFEISLPEATLNKVRKAMGRDFESHNITSNGIVHALKNHGENGLKLNEASIPLREEDVELIPYIMTAPDRVEKASTDASGRESVRFYKDLSNGYVVVVEKEYKNSPDDMETITMWAELSSKATNAQQNAAPDTHVRNAILSTDIAKIRKDAEIAIEEDENRKGKPLFRVKDNNELVAVHNISEENLRKVLNVGGLIMPSIAITKADMGHEGYGEISLLFDKETINPTDRRNKVYGGDAWTPRFPHLEIKLNDKVMSNLSKTIRNLIEDREVRELYSLSSEIYPDNIERKIANDGVEGYYGKEWMKLAYLLGNGKKVKIPMKMKDYGSMSEIILDMAKEKGLKASDIMNEGYDFYQNNPDFVNSILEIKNRDVINNLPEGKRDAARKFLKREISFGYFDSLISQAVRMEYDLEHGGLKKIIDKTALSASIEKKVKTNNADYNKWVDGLFNGIIEKYGIRNNRDMFTPSGSQRSWEQLHDAATPANILKYMLAENEQGGSGGFFDSNIMGASAESYESIEEIREKGKKRLRRLEEGEYDEWSDSVAKRMSEICNDFLSPSQRNEFGASIDAKIDITNAVAKDKTAKGIYKSMRSDYPGFTMEHAKKVEEIVKEIQEFAIGYFEAKPRRIVPLYEVKKAIVPKNTSKDILEGLKDNGIDVATYKNGDEAARSRLIKKESDGIRFRTVNEPARAYISESEAREIVDVPQSKVRYTKDNIASELYKTTGNHLRELYKGGVLGRVLRGDYAEIDQIKAKADYDKAKTHLGALLKDLVEMKHQATDAAQEVINGVIRDAEYSLNYYHDLAMGKDVWRTQDTPRFRVTNKNQEIFVSNAAKAVEGIKQEKATPQQWLAMIEKNGGLKAGEDKWLGLSDWLKASDAKTLTKGEVLDFINQNKIVIEEVKYSGSGMYDEWYQEDVFDAVSKSLAESKGVEFRDDFMSAFEVEYDDYVGRVNVDIVDDELAAKLYLQENENDIEFDEDGYLKRTSVSKVRSWGDTVVSKSMNPNAGDKAINATRLNYTTEGLENKQEIALVVPTIEPWNQSDEIHFGDAGEGRAVVWMRFGETEDAEGKKTLVIDEIQSKRHQEGRERGYLPKGLREVQIRLNDISDRLDELGRIESESDFGLTDEQLNEQAALLSEERELIKSGTIPAAPFEKNWSELAMKRMLRYAAENGFDKVAWTKGVQQAQRYSLGKVVDSVSISKSIKEEGKYHITSWDKDTMPIGIASGNKTAEELRELFGKSVADELINGVENLEEGRDTFVLEGADLEVGGEGMKGFYDKMLPSFVNKYVKKWGTKVQDIELPNVEEAGRIMHSVDVTDAMKESVMEGQTMFRISEKGKKVQAEVDKFTSKYNSKPVSVIDSEMTDEELEEAMPTSLAEDTREKINEGQVGGYSPIADKIYIFADNNSIETLEDTLFHENLHNLFKNHAVVDEFFNNFKERNAAFVEAFSLDYKKSDIPEEVFVHILAQGMVQGKLGFIDGYLSEESKNELFNILNNFGYEYEQEPKGRRIPERSATESEGVRTKGSSVQEVDEGAGKEAEPKPSTKERAERLKQLFDKVADMGLEGVLENRQYIRAMVDVYKALPEDVRADLAENALRNYDGSIAPAVSDYLNHEADASLWNKVVAIVRDALRKVGFDLDLNANEVKYLLWRSQKPLNRNSVLDLAEDIDKKFKLKVGEYSSTDSDNNPDDTPDGGGTRFRSKKKAEPIDIADDRPQIVKEYDDELKTKMFNFQEAFQDRMLSVKVLMDKIVAATGLKVRTFEDVYKAENELSSINRVEQERYTEKFYKPLLETLNKLSEKYSHEEVRRYIYCKSGLERNEVLRQRDADEAYEESKAELDEKLAKGNITQAQYNALLQQVDKQRADTLSKDVDYSGIRGMLINVRVAEVEKEYQEGRIDKQTRDVRINGIKANKEQIMKGWKKFAEDQVHNLEQKASQQELDALWDKINAATNETLRIDFESGMIDRETYNAEKNMMKYYVPLREWKNTTAEDMYEYRHDMTPTVSSNQKRAEGRQSEADNPIATIGLMAQNAIVRGNRNKMKQKLYAFVANRETALASIRNVWYEKDANGQWIPKYADTSNAKSEAEMQQIMDQFEQNMEALAEQGKAFKGKAKMGMGFRANRSQKDEHVVTVMINGKEYGIYINGNPRAAQAVNGQTNAEGIDDGYAWIDQLKRLYGGGLTSWNPDFIIPNLVRDTIHASTMTFLDRGVMDSLKYMANIPKIFAQVTAEVSGLSTGNPKLHQYFEEFVKNGGETGYTAIHTLEDYKKEYQKLMDEAKGVKSSIKKGVKIPFEKIASLLEAANRIAEDVNRFNAYVTAREAGENIVNSVDAAKNITVNFNRKGALHANNTVFGKVASFMNRWILFFNPSVQGIYQLVSKSKVNPKRATVLGATIMASGFFAPLLNEMLVAALGGDDDDDYWNQSDYKRRNNWMIFTGDGYVSIPLPPVLREIYGMGDIIYGVMTGHIPPQRAVYDILKQVQNAVGMINVLPEMAEEPDMITTLKGFAPDLAAPILDIATNSNFMGRPIAKWTDFNESDPEYMRVYKGTSRHWVELSKFLNEAGGNEVRRSDWMGDFINPAMMEHLVTSYTGGIGKTLNNFVGMITDYATDNKENIDFFRKAPIVPRFYTPNDERTVVPAINRKYYELKYQYNNATKALKKAENGVKSGEHPEWQKYIDEMKANGEEEFIEYFKDEQKKLKKIQNELKEDPNNKKLQQDEIDKKAEIATKSLEILK